MFEKLNKSYKNNSRFKIFGRSGIRRILEILLILSLVLVGGYALFFSTRVVSGVTRTVRTAENSIRLQILNGSSDEKAGERIAKLIKGIDSDEIDIEIIELSDFEKRNLSRSIVISRDREKSNAGFFSELIGFDSDDVIYRDLENNKNLINITLALGNDYKNIETVLTDAKE